MDFSFLNLILKSDIVIKFVVAILILFSLMTWAILFEKTINIKNIHIKADAFEKKFWSGIMLEEFYEKNRNKLKHPLGEVFGAAMYEWILSDTNRSIAAVELIKTGLRERIENGISVALEKISEQNDKYISMLNTIATTSPFIGLFGTVWGIMNSFKALGGSVGNVGLQAVAPGIAEALLTTAIGIIVAVNAIIIYAVIDAKLEKATRRIDIFAKELHGILSRELDAFSIRNYNEYQQREAQIQQR